MERVTMKNNIHIRPLQQPLPISTKKSIPKPPTTSFKDILVDAQQLKVSKHAKQRLAERDIEINDQQWQKVHEKVNEAQKKGITDSLVLIKNAALLVSVKNQTVVTAMSMKEASSKIFTNINGAIVVED